MARLIDAENYRNLFNEEFKKTMELIRKGETHLDTLAEGFTEADRVIRALPTIDPVHASGACYCRECTCWNRHDDILPDCRFPDWGYCSKMLDSDSEIEITTLENDFCSRGQRLEED